MLGNPKREFHPPSRWWMPKSTRPQNCIQFLTKDKKIDARRDHITRPWRILIWSIQDYSNAIISFAAVMFFKCLKCNRFNNISKFRIENKANESKHRHRSTMPEKKTMNQQKMLDKNNKNMNVNMKTTHSTLYTWMTLAFASLPSVSRNSVLRPPTPTKYEPLMLLHHSIV